MTKLILILLVLLCSTISMAFVDEASPLRAESETWQEAAQRNRLTDLSPLTATSVIHSAKNYHQQFDVSSLPEWPGTREELQAQFEKMRDERMYKQRSQPQFARRATWLYPQDGCFFRASHAAKTFESKGLARPGKLFLFGEFRVVTSYYRGGVLHWWYHVAAAYRIGQEAVVMDASVHPEGLLSLEQWLMKVGGLSSKTRVSVCDSFAYGIYNKCVGGNVRQEAMFNSHMQKFLSLEWQSLTKLGLDPEELLGENPPW